MYIQQILIANKFHNVYPFRFQTKCTPAWLTKWHILTSRRLLQFKAGKGLIELAAPTPDDIDGTFS